VIRSLIPLSILLVTGASIAASPPESTPETKQALASAIGAILQADGSRARDLLAAIADDTLSAEGAQLRACTISRLEDPPPATQAVSPATHAPNAFAAEALVLYRTYWRESMSNPAGRPDAEKKLLLGISSLLGRPPIPSMDDAEPLLAKQLAQAGFHSLEGKTGLLRELMIWTVQKERTESVPLPEGSHATRVYYLDGFVSRGWSSYLTCERTGSGGWAKPEGLYAVVPAYPSLTDESFRVRFLAHESQHYSDYRRFPGLASWELEYRAKLVELVYAIQTKDKVLSYFMSNQGDNLADAHSYADKRVLTALRARLAVESDAELTSIPVATLQQAALAELQADTLRRGRKPTAE
jgi:hypothetical protein